MSKDKCWQLKLSEISTRRADFPPNQDVSEVTYGGTSIYCLSAETMELVIEGIENACEQALNPHVSLARTVYASRVGEILGQRLERRLFGAIIGKLLRYGRVLGLPCLSVGGKVFRVFIHAERATDFDAHLERVAEELKKRKTLTVREVEGIIFNQREWGTWSTASHILAHLAFKGIAVYIDKDMFQWPAEVEDAVG